MVVHTDHLLGNKRVRTRLSGQGGSLSTPPITLLRPAAGCPMRCADSSGVLEAFARVRARLTGERVAERIEAAFAECGLWQSARQGSVVAR